MAGRPESSPPRRQDVPRVPGGPLVNPGMTSKVQTEFLYLFERVNEPLYYGPRGVKNYFYDVPIDNLHPKQQEACRILRKDVPASSLIKIPKPRAVPDLRDIAKLCGKNHMFYSFLPSHQEAAGKLISILLAPRTVEELLALTVALRDHPLINPALWLMATTAATLWRTDMRGLKIPSLWDIVPSLFLSETAKRLALEQSMLPAETRAVILVNQVPTGNVGRLEFGAQFTGSNKNPEQKLWYFREDIGMVNHHWHWHIIFNRNVAKGQRDRKGELFYYMHHDMLNRYDANRLTNGLSRVKPLDVSTGPVVKNGYFSKLTVQNSSQPWGTRQDDTKLRNVYRSVDGSNITVEELRKWKDRIFEAIDTGVVVDKDGNRVKLTEPTGIDILGGIVENGGRNLTINEKFYGNLHNMGHVIIASSNDPEYLHKENMGVMGDTATAVRDPVFFRWHRFIDDIFMSYKDQQPAYNSDEILWNAVKITNIEVMTSGQTEKNVLVSNWAQNDIDLTRGLDFSRPASQGPVWARLTRLNNMPFNYNIDVTFSGGVPATGTFRIFMAPRFDEHGERFQMAEQRHLFFEMDKFSFNFQPGDVKIGRSSTASVVTIPLEQSFRDIEAALTDQNNAVTAVCGCGWPQNLLFPKGTTEGVIFDLFVMITDGSKDLVPLKNPPSPANVKCCKEAMSFCGILDEKYPDAKPMGFPFDKPLPLVPGSDGELAPLTDLDAFVQANPNMQTIQVKIIHQNTVSLRPGGAPADAYTIIVPDDSKRYKGPRSAGKSSRTTRETIPKHESSPDRFSD